MSFSKKQRIIFLTKRTKKNVRTRSETHAKQKGKIMKVQAVKELTLSVLWVGTLSILVSYTVECRRGLSKRGGIRKKPVKMKSAQSVLTLCRFSSSEYWSE